MRFLRSTIRGALLMGMSIAAPPLLGQGVRGHVVDSSTGSPVVGALVTLLSVGGSVAVKVESDREGWFGMTARPGEYLLRVQRIGYREWLSPRFTLAAGEERELAARLTPSPVELPPAHVTGAPSTGRRPLAEFMRRRESGPGKFTTRAEFQDWHPRQLTDVLMRMPGIRLVRNPCFMMDATNRGTACYNPRIQGADTRRFILRPRGGPISFQQRGQAGEECGIVIYLDGRYVGNGLSLDLDFHPIDHVEAVEVYTGASEIPTEFNATGSACGVIVIWTR